jgi:hypothetical protein
MRIPQMATDAICDAALVYQSACCDEKTAGPALRLKGLARRGSPLARILPLPAPFPADGRALFLGVFLMPKLGRKLVALATILWIWLPWQLFFRDQLISNGKVCWLE